MSVAKIHEVGKARKAPGKCEKCGVELGVGDPYRWFVVGFRSKYKHVRCTKSECSPKISERESSMIADVYAAQEDFDLTGVTCIEDIRNQINDVAERVREVAQQYTDAGTNDQGVEWRPDMIERGEELEAVADELEQWEPDGAFEPCEDHESAGIEDTEDFDSIDWASIGGDDSTGEECNECRGNFDAWINDQIESATEAVNSMEV